LTRRILIVDDDEALGHSLRRYLSAYGFDISLAHDGEAMRAELLREKTDLVILDLVLPGDSGFDLAREIRRDSDIPIIMLTGRGEEVDRVVGLELGADDFVTKPFSSRELLARVNAVLRRTTGRPTGEGAATEEGGRIGRFLGWTIDVSRRKLLTPEGGEVRLTAGEFNVLLALMERPKRVLTREQILDCFMAGEPDVFDRSIDTRISRLRRKIEPDPKRPKFVKTEWGVGYFFDQQIEWEQ
jgi:DNA-binding response OmpR family regulator